MTAPYGHEPQIIVVEGLDGVGKSAVTRALVEITSGVDVTAFINESMGDSRRTVMDSKSANVRLHYWLAVNYLAGEYAHDCILANQTAVIDSYFFRTIACHITLDVHVNPIPILSEAIRPHRAVLLTVPEEVRSLRLLARDSDASEPAWHADLEARSNEVLGHYREFGLMEVDTSSTPWVAAMRILESSDAEDFIFTT